MAEVDRGDGDTSTRVDSLLIRQLRTFGEVDSMELSFGIQKFKNPDAEICPKQTCRWWI